MRAIKEELGDTDEDEDDIVALDRKLQNSGMPANVWKHTQRELRSVSSFFILWNYISYR
jgi:ATP-dependent Lon protease